MIPSPSYLQQGDVIDIISPGSGSTHNDIEKATTFIQNAGFTANILQGDIGEEPYHSEHDEKRFAYLRAALESGTSKAIWCMRGGYGTGRLLPFLHEIEPPKTPKWLVGFSDITALHLYIQKYWQWPTLHAAVLFQIAHDIIDQESVARTLAILKGEQPSLLYPLTSLNDAAKHTATLHTSLIGGNLSLLQTSIGTLWQADTPQKTLFIEEAFEKGYSIDRKLTHLSQAGLLDRVDAIILGDMQGTDAKDSDDYVNYAVQRFCQTCTKPVLRIDHIGHAQTNYPLPFGVPTTLTLGNTPKLLCQLEGNT